ncbi:universal stress protein [Actinophytocola sp.]|uniref:universal stress protein n=1 Tax=Actinophytocola sp. TaxID=1872138 RepID=UPI00389A84E8
MNTESRRVVAGVSTRDSGVAVRWAAAEAAARHAELRLVTARPAPAAPDRHLPNDVADAHRVAAAVLAELAAQALAGRPGLAVTTEVVTGSPAMALRTAADVADLLVVGADDASPFSEAISGSIPGDLLTATPCPLAVVPRAERAGPAASAPVVVVFDESPGSQAALAYAYAAAHRTGRPLMVLRCVTGGGDGTSETAQARLFTAFAASYPDVEVSTEVATDDPRHVLVAASRAASSLVMGTRGRGRLASSLFGSVERHLIRRSHCPVVVARTQPAAFALTS